MKIAAIDARSVLASALIVISLIVTFSAPVQAAAATTVNVQTAQVLPPGGNSCTPLSAAGFIPYIYDGSLHSFEFNVPDISYVAIAASAGSTNIPFAQMTRRVGPGGALRVHVDIETTPVGRSLPIRITMLSAKGSGQPVCIAGVLVSSIDSISAAPSPAPTPSPLPTPAPRPGVRPTPSPSVSPTPLPAPTPSPTTGPAATSAPVTGNIFEKMCAGGGAARMWFVLLAIYALIVAAAVLGQPQLPAAIRSQEWIAGAIVVPFLLLFGLWYFVEACRTTSWVPAIAILIALAGLGGAFWYRPSGTTVITLPSGKK